MNDMVFCGDNGQLMTTSLKVAEVFGKEHNKVVRDIENLSCSEDFRNANFGVSLNIREIHNGGNKQEKYYSMTKDGFTFLVMGYRGAKAAQFKEAYIEAFNKMQKSIMETHSLHSSVDTNVLKQLVETTRAMAAQISHMRDELDKRALTALPSVPQKVVHSFSGEQRIFPRQCKYYTVKQIAEEYYCDAKYFNDFLSRSRIQHWDEQKQRWALYDDLRGYGLTYAVVYEPADEYEEPREYMVWTSKGRAYIKEYIDRNSHGENLRVPKHDLF